MAPPRQEESDFNAGELLATQQQHGNTLSELTGRVVKIEGYLETPQKLADFFKEAAKDSRVLEGVFAEMFCRFIKDNIEVKTALEKKVDEVDREYIKKVFKRFGAIVWSGLCIVVGGIITALIQWAFAFFGSHK